MSEKGNPNFREPTIHSRRIHRRDFLKIVGAGLVSATAAHIGLPVANAEQPNKIASNPEIAQEEERFHGRLSFALIKGYSGGAAPVETIKRIEEALDNGTFDLILTPEFSFYTEGDNNHAVQFLKKNGKFELSSLSDPEYAGYLMQLQELAKLHQTNIFAATFKERVYKPIQMDPFVKTVDNDTLIRIDKNGEIVGLKRYDGKLPLGDWTIKKDDRNYRILPLICQEIAMNSDFNNKSDDGFYPSIGPEWLKSEFGNGHKADLFIHPQRLGDVRLDVIADVRQGLREKAKEKTNGWREDSMSFTQKGFDAYYGDYSEKYLKEGAPILTADYKIAAAFTSDGQTLARYIEDKNFVTATIDR